MAKIFESILCASDLGPNISRFQHAFVTGKSTVSNLCILSEYAFEAVKGKKQLDIIYTD